MTFISLNQINIRLIILILVINEFIAKICDSKKIKKKFFLLLIYRIIYFNYLEASFPHTTPTLQQHTSQPTNPPTFRVGGAVGCHPPPASPASVRRRTALWCGARGLGGPLVRGAGLRTGGGGGGISLAEEV